MIGPYTLKRFLGQGSASIVQQAEHKDTGQEVAIKIIKKGNDPKKRRKSVKAAREISILRAIDHPNVVKLHRTFESRTHFFLVMELVKGMELFDYLINKGKLTSSEALVIFSQVVKGLMACHEKGVVHRDLKAENILLDTQGNVKIVDFELANFVRTNPLKTFCGSSYYAPPEICSGQIYDGEKADVWSIGVLLYMMMVGEYPFDDENDAKLINKILHNKVSYPANIDSKIRDLIDQLLTKDPKQRLPCHRIPHHPCFYVEGRNMYFDISTHPSNPQSSNSDRRVEVLENLVLELERQLLPEIQSSFANLDITSHGKAEGGRGNRGDGGVSNVSSSSGISNAAQDPLQALATNPDWQYVPHSGSGGSINTNRASSDDEKCQSTVGTREAAAASTTTTTTRDTATTTNTAAAGIGGGGGGATSSRDAGAMEEEEENNNATQVRQRQQIHKRTGQDPAATSSSSSSSQQSSSPKHPAATATATPNMDGGSEDPLWWIMYRSQLDMKGSNQDPIDVIKKIARNSLHKNRSLGIGGMLYCDRKTGRIIQILEGRRSVLKQLAAAIMMDQRHTRFMIIKNEPVPQRRFKDWGMSFANTLSSFQRHRMDNGNRQDQNSSNSSSSNTTSSNSSSSRSSSSSSSISPSSVPSSKTTPPERISTLGGGGGGGGGGGRGGSTTVFFIIGLNSGTAASPIVLDVALVVKCQPRAELLLQVEPKSQDRRHADHQCVAA